MPLLSPCIETTYSRDGCGYGRANVVRHGRKIHRRHILAWVDAHGQLPPADKPLILHHCDNPACVNVDHLYAGTQTDNMRDRARRGRARNGRFPGDHRKTHCKWGHAFTPENTYVRRDTGRRQCKSCNRERQHRAIA